MFLVEYTPFIKRLNEITLVCQFGLKRMSSTTQLYNDISKSIGNDKLQSSLLFTNISDFKGDCLRIQNYLGCEIILVANVLKIN